MDLTNEWSIARRATIPHGLAQGKYGFVKSFERYLIAMSSQILRNTVEFVLVCLRPVISFLKGWPADANNGGGDGLQHGV